MKYSKNRKKIAMSKTLHICYLRHAEHHAKNRISLRGLDHDTLFFEWPVINIKNNINDNKNNKNNNENQKNLKTYLLEKRKDDIDFDQFKRDLEKT